LNAEGEELIDDSWELREEGGADWLRMKVQPVYEWCSEIEEGLLESMDATEKEIKAHD
jgi:hypothetical protein